MPITFTAFCFAWFPLLSLYPSVTVGFPLGRIYWHSHWDRFLLYKFCLLLVLLSSLFLFVAKPCCSPTGGAPFCLRMFTVRMSVLRSSSIVLMIDLTKWLWFSVSLNLGYPCSVKINPVNNTNCLLYINAHILQLCWSPTWIPVMESLCHLPLKSDSCFWFGFVSS